MPYRRGADHLWRERVSRYVKEKESQYDAKETENYRRVNKEESYHYVREEVS